jgi:hypothetical protein
VASVVLAAAGAIVATGAVDTTGATAGADEDSALKPIATGAAAVALSAAKR